SVGVDVGGTSAEGLADLLDVLETRGKVYVFRNAASPTFHPKVYLFKNDSEAEIAIGSGNLTEGGLFTNYEASFRLRLDLSDEDDKSILESVSSTLDTWSTPTSGMCYLLDSELLDR